MDLKQKEVVKLLEQIKHPEDKKAVKKFLGELKKIKSGSKAQNEIENKGLAKETLDIICRIFLEIGKHVAIEQILHMFD